MTFSTSGTFLETLLRLGELLSSDKNPFEVRLERGLVCAFVNFGGFSLHGAEMKNPAEMFWRQLDWIQPESYIADGTFLNFVSTDKSNYAAVRNALQTLE